MLAWLSILIRSLAYFVNLLSRNLVIFLISIFSSLSYPVNTYRTRHSTELYPTMSSVHWSSLHQYEKQACCESPLIDRQHQSHTFPPSPILHLPKEEWTPLSPHTISNIYCLNHTEIYSSPYRLQLSFFHLLHKQSRYHLFKLHSTTFSKNTARYRSRNHRYR